MRKIMLSVLAMSMIFTSCDLFNSHGKKVEINEKSHVFYKGEGVTESEAKKLGDYFLEQGLFNTTDEKSIQLTKDGDAYVVRAVVKEEVMNQNKEQFETIFWFLQDMISEAVFNGKETRMILTNDKFEDKFAMEPMNKVKLGDDKFVYWKGSGIKKSEAEEIGEKFEKENIFPFTNGSVLVTKEKGDLVVRFMANPERLAEGKDNYYATLGNLQYLISEYVLKGEDVKLVVIDAEFNDVKDFEELSADQKMVLDQRMRGTDPTQYDPNTQNTQTEYTNQQQQQPAYEDDDIEGGGY